MPKRTKTKYASQAQVAAYCAAHPEDVEMLAEMLGSERAEHVYRKLHPQPVLTEDEMRKAMQGSENDRPARYCPYRIRGLECRNAGSDGICRCNAPRPLADGLRDVLRMLDDAVLYLGPPDASRYPKGVQLARDARNLLRSELELYSRSLPQAQTLTTAGRPLPAPPYRVRRLRTK
jgi:hypothetical protein